MNSAYEDNFEQSRHRACFLESTEIFQRTLAKKV